MNASITPSATASLFLRRVLLADAIVSGGVGLLLLLGAGPLGDLLGLPPALLRWIGPTLLPWAALLAYLGTRERLAAPLIWAVIGLNLLWVVAGLLLLASGWVAPTTLGSAFVLVQALAVAGFAELQYVGLRRAASLSV
jgi:hypothetical protein